MPSIAFKNGKISYSDAGNGIAVIFLHGFLGNKNLWNKQVYALKTQFRTICIDLPGHGKSDDFGYTHSMELMAEAVKAVLRKLRLRKVILIGHSLGGYVALAFAEKYPDMLKGLIMVNSSAKGDTPSKTKSRNQLLKLIKKDKAKALNLLVPGFFSLAAKNRNTKIKNYLKSAQKCSAKGIAACIEGMKIRREREIILRFAPFPFCYFIGKYDQKISPKDQIDETKLNKKGSYIQFEHSSHMIFMEEAEKCTQNIRIWIKKL